MAVYTQLSASDLQEILGSYGIEADECRPVPGGYANSNFYLRSNGREYMLTIAEEKSATEMRHLASLLQWLGEHGFYTSQFCRSIDGRLVTAYLGKSVLLKRWITGEVHDPLNSAELHQVGQAMAELHQVPAPDYLPRDHPYGHEVFESVLGTAVDPEYESWLNKQIRELSRPLPENLPRGMIHGDVFFDNLLFENDRLKAIIDFEEACHYYLVCDLGMSILGTCREAETINLQKASSLIDGYQQVRRLELCEKDSLKQFVVYSAAATSCWRFRRYNILAPNPERRHKHREMMRVANWIDAVSDDEFASAVFF